MVFQIGHCSPWNCHPKVNLIFVGWSRAIYRALPRVAVDSVAPHVIPEPVWGQWVRLPTDTMHKSVRLPNSIFCASHCYFIRNSSGRFRLLEGPFSITRILWYFRFRGYLMSFSCRTESINVWEQKNNCSSCTSLLVSDPSRITGRESQGFAVNPSVCTLHGSIPSVPTRQLLFYTL